MLKGTCIGKGGLHHLVRPWQPLRTVTAWVGRHQGQEKQIEAGGVREGELVRRCRWRRQKMADTKGGATRWNGTSRQGNRQFRRGGWERELGLGVERHTQIGLIHFLAALMRYTLYTSELR